MEDKTLRAVHDDDLEDVLKGLGVYGDFVQGQIKCAFSKDVITWDNLHALFPDSGAVKAVCTRPECISGLLAWMDERRS